MPRKPLPLGTWGRISRTEAGPGRWVARCRFRDFDGRTRQIEAWGKTGAAAERALISALTDRAAPSDDELTPETTLARLAAKWLAEVDEGALATNTRQRYREVADDYVVAGLGSVRIREITVGRVEAFLRTIVDHHGQASARLARTVLSGMFALASRHDAAPRNIVKDSAAVRVTSKEVRALTVSEVRSLRAGLRADKRAIRGDVPDVVDAMLATGARIGEILALRWDDVDLGAEVPTVTISGTVVRVAGQGLTIQDHPKSASSRRRLRIPAFLVEVLLRRQVAQVEATAFNVVFPSSTGTLRDPTNFRDQWRQARDRLGMTWVVPHTFRKSVATVLAATDLRTAAGQLGHAGTAVTEKHYVVKTHEGPDARTSLDVFDENRSGDTR
jgi:integrase